MDYAFKLYLQGKNEKENCAFPEIENTIVLCTIRLKSFNINPKLIPKIDKYKMSLLTR